MPYLLRFAFLFLLAFGGKAAFGQCAATADAGADLTACVAGGAPTLSGSVDLAGGELLGVEWSPAASVANATSETTTFLGTATTTLTFTASVIYVADNLLVNADFDDGTLGWTTEYDPGPGGPFGTLSLEGTYAVDFNAGNTHNNFANCGDHTGGGQMLVVNGATTPNEQIYCQLVNVMPNTTYALRAWVQSVISTNPARLQFSVNGQLVGEIFRPSSTVCNWGQFDDEWASGASTTAEMCIVNQNTQGSGNDFAIDDLYFGPVCEVSDEVTVTVIDTEIVLESEVTLPCNLPTGGFEISAAAPAGPDYTYLWSTADGNIVSGETTLTPNIDLPGTYTLTLSYDDGVNTCQESASILVRPSPNVPNAVASAGGILTCDQTQVALSSAGSSTGSSVQYFWEATVGGNFVGASNGSFVLVDAPGTYTLTVVGFMGCSSTATVEVTQNLDAPAIDIAPVGTLSCSQSSLIIDAAASEAGPTITSAWTASNGGAILSGADGYAPVVGSAGTYTFRLTNTVTGCFTEEAVMVTGAPSNIVAVAGAMGEIGCDGGGTILLSGAGSTTGTGVTYEWSSPNGGVLSGPTDELTATATAPGTYVLLITDTGTGCSNTASVIVEPIDGLPVANANEDKTITCAQSQVFLDATGSSAGPNFTSQYLDEDDNVLPSIAITEPGVFRLVVTNTDNNCVAVDSVTVFIDTIAPNAPINAPASEVTCARPELLIGTDQFGAGFTFQWMTADGAFTGVATAPSIAVTAAGTYALTTTNPANGCRFTDEITVTEDLNTPVLSIAPPTAIDCDNPTQQLVATDAATGNFNYAWTTTTGVIIDGANTLTPSISAGGVYQLIADNPGSGCADTLIVDIQENGAPPPATVTGQSELTCDLTELDLSAVNPIPGDTVSYTWSTDDGEILTDPAATTVTIGAPGTYLLTVVNAITGCTSFEPVTITEEVTAPLNTLAEGQYELSCNVTTAVLTGAAMTVAGLEYVWSVPSSNPQQTSATATLLASVAGDYTLTVRDPANGCTTTRTVPVTQDRVVNEAFLSVTGPLSCRDGEVDLLGGVAREEADYFYRFFDAANATVPDVDLVASVTNAGRYGLVVTNLDNGCSDTAFVEVTESFTPPLAEAGAGLRLDCANPTLALDGSASTLGDSITYAWFTLDGNLVGATEVLSPRVDRAGRYRLLVTNRNNGCTAEDVVDVTSDLVAPPLEVALTQVLSCLEEERTLGPETGPSPGVEYAWYLGNPTGTPLSTEANLRVGAPGTYLIVATDPTNGCTTDREVNVTEDKAIPTATIAAGENLSCTTTTTELEASLVTGTTADFSWATVDGAIASPVDQPNITVSDAGTYQLITVDPANGCRDTSRLTVTIDTLRPRADLLPVEMLTCANPSFDLSTDPATRLGDYQYAWSTASGNIISPVDGPFITINLAGAYDLLITNELNGCEQRLGTVVTQDTVAPILNELAPDTITCSQTEVTTSATTAEPAVIYSWTIAGGSVSGPTDTPTLTVTGAGNYLLTATGANNGCVTTATWLVTENTARPTATLPATFDLGCDPVPTELTAEVSAGAFDYNWSTSGGTIIGSGTTPVVTVDGPGVYTFVATDPTNDCSATASTEVILNTLDSFSFELTPIACNTETARLQFTGAAGGVEPYIFSADGGQTYGTGLSPRALDPGVYELRAQDSRGCEAVDSITVDSFQRLALELPPVVRFPIGDSAVLNLSLNFSPTVLDTIIWSPARDLSCTACLTPVASPQRTTTYEVSVTSEDGCVANALINVEVDERLGVYFPTGFSPNGDGQNDRFHPFGDSDRVLGVSDFRVHDRWGNAVYEADAIELNNSSSGWDGNFRGKPVNPAVYVYSAVVDFLNGDTVLVKGEVTVVR